VTESEREKEGDGAMEVGRHTEKNERKMKSDIREKKVTSLGDVVHVVCVCCVCPCVRAHVCVRKCVCVCVCVCAVSYAVCEQVKACCWAGFARR
jgi:hypothetical protein